MTKKEIDIVLRFGQSHIIYVDNCPTGVTRFQAFLAIKPLLKAKLYWKALRDSYDCSDNLYYYRIDVKMAFESTEPERYYLMNNKERSYLDKLPEQMTIYRGMTKVEQDSKDFGVSWTLKKETAEYFAKEYQRNYATNQLKNVVHSNWIHYHLPYSFNSYQLSGAQLEFQLYLLNFQKKGN